MLQVHSSSGSTGSAKWQQTLPGLFMPVLENAGDSLNVLTEDGEMRIFTSFLKKSENTNQGAKGAAYPSGLRTVYDTTYVFWG